MPECGENSILLRNRGSGTLRDVLCERETPLFLTRHVHSKKPVFLNWVFVSGNNSLHIYPKVIRNLRSYLTTKVW